MLMTAFNFSTVDYRPPTITGPGAFKASFPSFGGSADGSARATVKASEKDP